MSYFQKHKKAFYGTFIFHAIVLILLIVCGFFTPLPLPEEEGLLVDFGDSPTGAGRYEPPKQRKSVVVKQKTVQKKTKPTQPKVTSKPKPAAKPVSKPKAKQQVMTQDFEKTATVDNGAKREEERKKKALEERKRKENLRKAQEERERKEAEEAERKRLAEIERKKKAEEAERQRIAQERAQKKAAIDKMTQNAFSGAGKSTSTSKGQGVSYPGGNQGVKTGTANAKNYGPGGGAGNGPSYSLSGRSALSLPQPNYPGEDEGVVVVQVTVNKYGKVTKAIPGAKGTNTSDADLWAAAKKAAMAARFNLDDKAPAFQQGTITYRFVLD
ncbi:hypothetical protein EYV94_01300 [Puteibacter caeruleilacunae]|nr:hypothetical protein EYV94_01300 [Puteibacter caeruleilacunae]